MIAVNFASPCGELASVSEFYLVIPIITAAMWLPIAKFFPVKYARKFY